MRIMMSPRLYCRECGWHPHYRSDRAALRAARRHRCPQLDSRSETFDAINFDPPSSESQLTAATLASTMVPEPTATPPATNTRDTLAARPLDEPRWWQRWWHALTRRRRTPGGPGRADRLGNERDRS